MSFNNISIFTSGGHLVQQSGLGNFCIGFYEEHFCDTILTSDKWLRCRLKIILF